MPTLRVDNPFTENVACELPLAEWPEIDRLLAAAREGARIAAASTLAQRKALVERAIVLMEERAEQIASDISRMMGKPLE